MAALLKTTQIQEPSASLVNLTLSTAGGVTVAQNLTVTGTTTLSGGLASSGLTLSGASSGTTVLSASASASGTATLPAGTGTVAVQGVSTNIVSGTAQLSTSGTTISFPTIPSWATRITVMFFGVSLSSTGNLQILLGTGATPTYATSGYLGSVANQAGTSTALLSTSFQLMTVSTAASTWYGTCVFVNQNGNNWVASSQLSKTDTPLPQYMQGGIALGAVLTALRISSTGADTFDAGSINILYE